MRRLPLQESRDLHHIQHGNALGDAHDQGDASISCLHDSVCGKGRRNKYDRGVCSGLVDALGDGTKDRDPLVDRPSLAGGYSRHYFSAILKTPPGVEAPLSPGDSLDHQPCVVIDQYTHARLPSLGSLARPAGGFDGLRCGFGHRASSEEIQSRLFKHLPPEVYVGPFHPDHHRHLYLEGLHRLN